MAHPSHSTRVALITYSGKPALPADDGLLLDALEAATDATGMPLTPPRGPVHER